MEFAPIYFEPEVYTKLIAPITRVVNRFDTDVYAEVMWELTQSKGWYDSIAHDLNHADMCFYEDKTLQELEWLEGRLESLNEMCESGCHVEDARRCITAMLKDVYLWLNRYYNSEAMAANNASQGFLGEADKYLEKNNQLHI